MPPSDDAVIWLLVDAGVHLLSVAERGSLFADIAAGDYLTAAKRILAAAVSAGHPLPASVTASINSWLDRYAGAQHYPTVRVLADRASLSASPAAR